MGKKGHLTFEKRALNIRRGVRAHPTHPPRYATELTCLKTKAVSSIMA